MFSLKYFCVVGEFRRTTSKPCGDLFSKIESGAAVIAKAIQQRSAGMEIIRKTGMIE